MKKLPLVLLAIVSLFVLAGCHGDKQYDDLLQQADSIMNINDDSAKVAIKLLDKAKPQLNDFSKAQRMLSKLCEKDGKPKELDEYIQHLM